MSDRLQTIKTEHEVLKMRLEMDKLRAEIRKLNRDYGLAPFLAGVAASAVLISAATFILKLVSGR